MSTTVSVATFERKMRMLARWDFCCVVCGRPFETFNCVTREHILPKSTGLECVLDMDNIAPSHHNCNSLKAALPLVEASKKVEEKLASLGSIEQQRQWLNAPPMVGRRVPNRLQRRFELAMTEKKLRSIVQRFESSSTSSVVSTSPSFGSSSR